MGNRSPVGQFKGRWAHTPRGPSCGLSRRCREPRTQRAGSLQLVGSGPGARKPGGSGCGRLWGNASAGHLAHGAAVGVTEPGTQQVLQRRCRCSRSHGQPAGTRGDTKWPRGATPSSDLDASGSAEPGTASSVPRSDTGNVDLTRGPAGRALPLEPRRDALHAAGAQCVQGEKPETKAGGRDRRCQRLGLAG